MPQPRKALASKPATPALKSAGPRGPASCIRTQGVMSVPKRNEQRGLMQAWGGAYLVADLLLRRDGHVEEELGGHDHEHIGLQARDHRRSKKSQY